MERLFATQGSSTKRKLRTVMLGAGVILTTLRFTLCCVYCQSPRMICLDNVIHISLWIIMGIMGYYSIRQNYKLRNYLHYKDISIALTFVALPLLYHFWMVKFLYFYSATYFNRDIQLLGGIPAISVILELCIQFRFMIQPLRQKCGLKIPSNIINELQQAALYVKKYNYFMLFHLTLTQTLSISTNGLLQEGTFLALFELFSRVWGIGTFEDIGTKILPAPEISESNGRTHTELVMIVFIQSKKIPHVSRNFYAPMYHNKTVITSPNKDIYYNVVNTTDTSLYDNTTNCEMLMYHYMEPFDCSNGHVLIPIVVNNNYKNDVYPH